MIWLQSSLFLTIWLLCMIIMECHLQRKQTLRVTAEDLSNWSFSSVTNHFGAWEKFVFIYFIQDKLTQKEESSDPESKSSIGPIGKIYQGTLESSSSAGKAFNICHRAVLPPLIYRWSIFIIHCSGCRRRGLVKNGNLWALTHRSSDLVGLVGPWNLHLTSSLLVVLQIPWEAPGQRTWAGAGRLALQNPN